MCSSGIQRVLCEVQDTSWASLTHIGFAVLMCPHVWLVCQRALSLLGHSYFTITTFLRVQQSWQRPIPPVKPCFIGVLLCFYPPLFAHFVKTRLLKNKIKEMTSKLNYKAAAHWVVSDYEFFMFVPSIWLSKMGMREKSIFQGVRALHCI